MSVALPQPHPLARNTDPGTSHAAAKAIDTDSVTRQQAAILSILREHPGGLTDRELTVKYFARAADRDWPITELDSVRKRRSQLTSKGKVITTEFRRDERTHRDAALWRVKP